MFVNIPVNVVSVACRTCPRLKVIVLDDNGARGEVVDRVLECSNYDNCLNTVDMYRRGEKEIEERNRQK